VPFKHQFCRIDRSFPSSDVGSGRRAISGVGFTFLRPNLYFQGMLAFTPSIATEGRNGDRLGRRLEDAPERAPESTAVEIDSSSRVGATTVRLVHHSLPPRPWPTISGDGAICWRRSVASCRRDWARQAWGWVMFTIQGMPNRSTHMPNSSPHICLSRGIVTVPPSDSFCQ
jgi:hypothetical protein